MKSETLSKCVDRFCMSPRFLIMPKPFIRLYGHRVALIAILLIGLWLRVWGIRYGLPHIYFTDEAMTVNQTLAMGYTHSLRPEHYSYPTGLMYVLGALYSAYYVFSFLFGTVTSTHDFAISVLRDPTPLYLIGRSVSVAAGVATIVLVYVIGKHLFDRRAGLVAAAIMAFTNFLVYMSHFIKAESLETFLVLCAFGWALKASKGGKTLCDALAGLVSGFAAAMKYNGAFVLFSLFIVSLRSGSPRSRRLKLFVIVGSFLLGFLILTPYVLLDAKQFLSDVKALEYFKMLRVVPSAPFAGWWQISIQLLGFGFTLLYLCGIFYGLFHPDWKTFALLAFPAVHFTFFNLASPWRNLSWQIPIFPFLALLSGAFFSWLWYYLNRRRFRLILIILVLAAMVESGFLAARKDFLLAQPDTRTLALNWIEQNIPAGSILVMDHGQYLPYMAPPVRQSPSSIDRNYLNQAGTSGWVYRNRKVYFELLKRANREPMYEVYPILHDDFGGKSEFWNRPPPRLLDWYRSQGVAYAVLAGFEERYHKPEIQAQFGDYVKPYLSFYDSVSKEGRLLAEFLPKGRLGYRIRVYCVAKSCMAQ